MARRAAIYARVSTAGQTAENQLPSLRAFATARGWEAIEYVDTGISGAKERRPQLDALMAEVRARRADVVVCAKLDRLARSVQHLVGLAQELQALGVDLVVLDQQIDTTTPAGRLLFHMLAAIAEFERDLIRERVRAGLRRVKAAGKRLGRPQVPLDRGRAHALLETHSYRQAARILGVGVSTLARAVPQTPERAARVTARKEASQQAGNRRPTIT